MRVLLLGGGGFIGRHLVEPLTNAGHSVRIFGRSPVSGLGSNVGIETVTGDFRDRAALSAALNGVEAVYHLISTTVPATAEIEPAADVRDNLIGTLDLLDEMHRQGISRLIYLSSGGTVYGNPDSVPVPETHPLRPFGSYGIVKAAVESFLTRQSRFGLVPVVIRAANVYGPFQSKAGLQGFVGTVLWRLAKGEPVEMIGDGSVIRDFLHVRDLANLCVRVLSAKGPETINAGSGRGTSLRDVVNLAEQISGLPISVNHLPKRATDVSVSVLNIQRANDLFGWAPQISLETGMAQTWNWVQDQLSLERSS